VKLFWSATSPFARKVRIAAREIGVELACVAVKTAPASPDGALQARNPLAKIPTLETDEGELIFDSHVICDYLDRLHGEHRLIPEDEPLRSRVLRLEALADGLIEAGLAVRYEELSHPEAARSAEWIRGQSMKVRAAIDWQETRIDTLGLELDLGRIALVCALDWLAFRKPVPDLETRAPRLWRWLHAMHEQPGIRETMPA
jgi:glutathione S-transferase